MDGRRGTGKTNDRRDRGRVVGVDSCVGEGGRVVSLSQSLGPPGSKVNLACTDTQ